MKSRFSPRLLTVFLAVIVVLSMWPQRETLSKLDVENRRLQMLAAEAQQLSTNNQQVPLLRSLAAQAETLRAETRDLHKLRNEVHQLRNSQKEINQTRADNERLHRLQKAGTHSGVQASETIPFLTSARLVDRGQATPEAAAQTLLWAIREGNLEKIKGSVTNRIIPEAFVVNAIAGFKIWSYTGQSFEDRSLELKEIFKDVRGMRVVDQQSTSPEEVQLTLQISTVGDNGGIRDVPVRARLVGSEWKLTDGNDR